MSRITKRDTPIKQGRARRGKELREAASVKSADWEEDESLDDDVFSALDNERGGDNLVADPDEGSRFARQMNARRQLERLRESQELERQCNDDWALTG